MMLRYFFFLVVVFCCSCAVSGVERLKVDGTEVLNLCSSKIEQLTGKPLSNEVDNAYVFIFNRDYQILFMHGTLGTFEKFSPDSRTIWSCSVTQNKVVGLGAPLKDPLVDLEDIDSLEDFSEDVIEVRFKREKGTFKYCCSQKFDEKNIEKLNPGYPSKTNMVG